MSELILNLSSERIFVSLIRQDKPMNISNRGSLNESRSYFDSFAICKDELTYDHLQISESSKINLSSLVYPLDFMASNSNNSMVEKVSDYQNFRIIPSKDDHLVYVKDEASISPEEIERFILEDIVKRIENKGVTITKLSVIIPDSFEQQKRVTLFSIIQSFFPHPTSIRFVNASVAAISCLSQDFLSSSPSIAVVLHMDSGHFDISIYSDLRKDTASCCFSASCNIGGIDIVNKSYEYFLQDISKEKPIKKSEIQKNYLIINWMKIKNMILDNNDDILSLRVSMSQSYDYSSEYTEKAIQDIIPILIHTIETSIQLAGIQPRDVGFVILSGIWNTVLPFETKTRSLFPLAKYHNFTAFDLNSSMTVSKTNYRHISPCLSTAWGLAYATEKKLIADRFVTFPYKSEGVFSFTPVEDDKYLTLFALPLDSTKQINIKKYDLSPFCIFGKKMTIWYTISVDRNGILSEEIYCDANKHKRIYSYNSSVCFKFHYLLYLSEDNKMEIVADRYSKLLLFIH